MNNSTPEFDLDVIVNRSKQQWLSSAKQQMTFQERIAVTVPWWLIIIVAGLFALSAGHTVGVFNHLSPVGYAGPFVVEFSLLWAAFARGVAKQNKTRISLALRFLEVIAFLMAIAANGIGAASYIADRSQVSGQSWAGIIQTFSSLPLPTQMELLFVPFFALLIPVGTWAGGEGIADLILTERRVGTYLEQQWKMVEQEIVRRALYAEFIKKMSLVDAKRQADIMSSTLSAGASTRISRTGRPEELKLIPERVSRATLRMKQRGPDKDARGKVQAYLRDNPDAAQLSVRALASVVGVGKSIAAEELARWKQEHGQL